MVEDPGGAINSRVGLRPANKRLRSPRFWGEIFEQAPPHAREQNKFRLMVVLNQGASQYGWDLIHAFTEEFVLRTPQPWDGSSRLL